MSKLRYSVVFEVDKNLLCDEETLKTDFNYSWQQFMDWFYEQESVETMTGLGSEPIKIKVYTPKSGKKIK